MCVLTSMSRRSRTSEWAGLSAGRRAGSGACSGAPPPARGSSPSPPRAPPHHPLCPPHVKADAANLKWGQSQPPPIHLHYPPPVSGDGATPRPAPVSHQAPPVSHLRTNGLMLDDMRGGANAKRRPGGAGTREVHNKLEQNR
ncbi:max-binding protein MNT-like [Hippocampus comes]|uniref:max-binding protein MNT-like n=1 Tax=Hippocampus comes TaxID=109280 RepID=UPI00094E5B87|nr:PREDICTED: max-binding protein MNT-like [Hippocampus comes]